MWLPVAAAKKSIVGETFVIIQVLSEGQ